LLQHPILSDGLVFRLLRKQKPKACISAAPWVNLQKLAKRAILACLFTECIFTPYVYPMIKFPEGALAQPAATASTRMQQSIVLINRIIIKFLPNLITYDLLLTTYHPASPPAQQSAPSVLPSRAACPFLLPIPENTCYFSLFMVSFFSGEHMYSKVNIGKDIFKKHNVKFAYLFGSQAKGNAVEQSDFDIAVLFKEPPFDPLALRETMDLCSDLSNFFPNKIDIVSLHYAPLLLKYEVVAHSRVLYCENEVERVNFEVAVIKEYIDEEPIRNLYNEALYKRILQGV